MHCKLILSHIKRLAEKILGTVGFGGWSCVKNGRNPLSFTEGRTYFSYSSHLQSLCAIMQCNNDPWNLGREERKKTSWQTFFELWYLWFRTKRWCNTLFSRMVICPSNLVFEYKFFWNANQTMFSYLNFKRIFTLKRCWTGILPYVRRAYRIH